MNEYNERVCLQFYLGETDDDAKDCSYQFTSAEGLPRVGEKVGLWGTRDEKGNYTDKDIEYFSGIVTRVEHFYEQRGKSSQEWSLIHFIHIFIKPEDSK